LKRDAKDQAKQGIPVKRLLDAQPGDLVYFHNEDSNVTHVGILLENHRIIHASGHVRIDRMDEKGIFNESVLKHTHEIAGIRRFIHV
jgi:cell wall-associated NlpC family hydrolase